MAIKQVVCLLSGETIDKRASIVVAGHRVKKSLATEADNILVKGAKVFAHHWHTEPKSARSRLSSLANAVCVMKQCMVDYNIDPMVFVVEAVRLCQELGDPVPMTFVQKLVDYTQGVECHELSKPNVKRAIELGYALLKETT